MREIRVLVGNRTMAAFKAEQCRLPFAFPLRRSFPRKPMRAGVVPPLAVRQGRGLCALSALERRSRDSGLWTGETLRSVGADKAVAPRAKSICRNQPYIHALKPTAE